MIDFLSGFINITTLQMKFFELLKITQNPHWMIEISFSEDFIIDTKCLTEISLNSNSTLEMYQIEVHDS